MPHDMHWVMDASSGGKGSCCKRQKDIFNLELGRWEIAPKGERVCLNEPCGSYSLLNIQSELHKTRGGCEENVFYF